MADCYVFTIPIYIYCFSLDQYSVLLGIYNIN